MSPPARTEAAGSKDARGCYTSRSFCTGSRQRKNTQSNIMKQAKKMCSGKCNSQDLVLGEEHTYPALRRKLKILYENVI
jgi:hypothetical protein